MLSVALAELLGTFFFVAVILATASEAFGAFAIGLALTISIFFTSKASLGSMNPAVSLALWLNGKLDTPTLIIYIAAEVVGAALAVMWWRYTLGYKKK
jgi:aquaporin Z